MYYSLSRSVRLDVKWANLFDIRTNASFFEEHHNPYFELIVAAEGTVHLLAGESLMTLQAGESLLLRPWERHVGWNPKEPQGKFFWTQFSCDPGMNEFVLNRVPELNIVHAERTELRTVEIGHEDVIVLPRVHRNRQPYKLLGLFEELAETMKRPNGYFRFHATLLLDRILEFVANDFIEQSHLDTAFPLSYLTFRKLVDHINNFYESDISRERLEKVLERKYEYLCQVFKKYAGTSIHHYVLQLKIQRSKYLLHNTSKSITEIAREVGFQDPFYFSRMFKKIEGVAPQHFRDAGNRVIEGG